MDFLNKVFDFWKVFVLVFFSLYMGISNLVIFFPGGYFFTPCNIDASFTVWYFQPTFFSSSKICRYSDLTEFRKSRSLNSPVGALSDVQLFAFFHFNDFLNIVSNHFQCKMENCRLEIEIPFKNVGVFFVLMSKFT